MLPLSDQHTDNPHTTALISSFHVLFDTAHMWNDVPGLSSVLAVHVERDLAEGVFEIAFARYPLVAMAQQWLVGRGATPDRFTDRTPVTAADQETTRVERLLREAEPDRYAIHDHYTYADVPYDTWVIATDTHNDTSARPVRVFHEQHQVDADTYTLREGHFTSIETARTWAEDPSAPLPQVAPSPSAQAAAARQQTQGGTGTGTVVGATPAAPPPVTDRTRAR
ncbi:hypothetical protein [Kitasatospora sp. NPDC057015]|uniref:hypothetical protein n=1 Tax=Kitasatospora sp. NPDC057015 TaxID=3346001 RepID=UPI00363F419D